MKSFFSERHYKALLNKESFYWANVRTGILQDSILGSIFCFFFLSFINDFPDGLLETVKHFAELQLSFENEICQNYKRYSCS